MCLGQGMNKWYDKTMQRAIPRQFSTGNKRKLISLQSYDIHFHLRGRGTWPSLLQEVTTIQQLLPKAAASFYWSSQLYKKGTNFFLFSWILHLFCNVSILNVLCNPKESLNAFNRVWWSQVDLYRIALHVAYKDEKLHF